MGILKNLVNAKVSGNVGSMNFRKRGSQTVVAERSYTNISKGNGASLLQRQHRSRLANIVNFFRVIAAIEARAWQNKPENNSDFNMFGKYNLAASPVFLTKQEAQARASVVAPYEVSRGTLTALVQSFEEAGFNTGVLVLPSFDMETKTLGEFSTNVINNNEGWRNGDKLSIALLNHSMKEVAGLEVPQTSVVYVEITLDAASEVLCKDIPGVAGGSITFNSEGALICGANCVGAFAIHSRKVGGYLETSSQSIIIKDVADPIIVRYTDPSQQDLAMASYGYQGDVLLTPSQVAPTPSEQAITSIGWNGKSYTTPRTGDAATANLQVTLSVVGTFLGAVTATGATLVTTGGSATLRTATVLIPAQGTAYTIKVGDTAVVSGTAAAPANTGGGNGGSSSGSGSVPPPPGDDEGLKV